LKHIFPLIPKKFKAKMEHQDRKSILSSFGIYNKQKLL
jgi:Ca2+-binding EF-hand superfamily protein